MEERHYTVSRVAGLAGVSVRTLHHYDQQGLLRPSGRSAAGYRLYTMRDLERLQQILFFRELGFGLADIGRFMSEPGLDRQRALRVQGELLREKAARLEALIKAVDVAAKAAEKGVSMDENEMFEVFGDFDPSEYEDEVKERWGHTEAYRESARRTAGYKKEDWLRIKEQGGAVTDAMIALLDEGVPPEDPRVQKAIEGQWRWINDNFYSCPPEMIEGLGEMYVADPRFAKTYEDLKPGLARFMRDAMKVWAGAHMS